MRAIDFGSLRKQLKKNTTLSSTFFAIRFIEILEEVVADLPLYPKQGTWLRSQQIIQKPVFDINNEVLFQPVLVETCTCSFLQERV